MDDLQLVVSKTNRIGNTKHPFLVYSCTCHEVKFESTLLGQVSSYLLAHSPSWAWKPR